MTHEELVMAIIRIRPGAKFCLSGDSIEQGLEWLEKPESEGGQKRPTLAECQAVLAETQADVEASQKRAAAREIIQEKRDLAVRKLVGYIAKDANAPADLKAVAADIAAAEADLEPEK